MKAIVQDKYGPPDVLDFRDVDKPVPADNEVLVRVQAAAVNAYDWHVMRGDPYLARLAMPAFFGLAGPKRKVRGRDFAGVVEAVGAGVTRLSPGDEVFGDLGYADGAFAEYAAAPDEQVELKPANLTPEQAAALPLAGNTALMGVRDAAQVRPGQHVLVNGASGGVGTFAVQIAKAYGAEVTAVCSTRNVDLVRSIGADHVVDYTRQDFAAGGDRYDVVFDLVGNRSLADLRRAMTPNGTLVLSGGGSSGGGNSGAGKPTGPSLVGPMGLLIKAQLVSRFASHRIVQLTEKSSRQNLATLRELVESGKVTPVVDRTYPLSGVPEAIRYVEVEHAQGKVVITV
jgi:NADPH:quinone reductase-like Zn-dependent oxidoreductase